jgi:hypothetical protein
MKAGDYVRCNFPFREMRGPGPFAHIVLVLGVGRTRSGAFGLVAYTTTRIAFEGTRRPRQHLLVDERRALALGQNKPFVVDASRIARLPLNSDYFPDLQSGNVPSFGRDPAFVDRVAARIRELIEAGFVVSSVDLTPKA